MQIYYKPAGSVGNYVLLLNEAAGDALEKFPPQFADVVMPVAGYGAANQTHVPLANTRCSLSLRWSANYASAAAALAAINTIRAAFKGKTNHLQLVEGATTLYLPNAVLESSAHEPHGKECWHQLNLQTHDITSTAP